MRDRLRIPHLIRKLWKTKIEPPLQAWEHLDALRSFIALVWRIGLFLFPGSTITAMFFTSVGAARGWFSAYWVVVVVVAGVASSLAIWIVQWRTQRHTVAVPLIGTVLGDEPEGKTEAPNDVALAKKELAVEYAGIRWVHVGYYPKSDTPKARAECPQHKLPVFYKDILLSAPREPKDTDIIGLFSTIRCVVDPKGHSLNVPIGIVGVSFGQLRRVAEVRLEAELRNR